MTSKVEKNEGVNNHLMIAFIIGLILLLVANLGFAQEQTLKSGDATEAVSTAKEAKPIIAVPTKLAKAIAAAKEDGDKTGVSKKADKKVKKLAALVERWFEIITVDTANVNNKSSQILGEELSSPPANTPNPSICSTANTSGQPCAVRFMVDEDIDEEEFLNLSVSDAETAFSTIADAYARHQP